MAGGLSCEAEIDAVIDAMLHAMQKADTFGWLPLILLERAGLSRLRGDMEGMRRDLAEDRQRLVEMNVTGWEDYARSIEG